MARSNKKRGRSGFTRGQKGTTDEFRKGWDRIFLKVRYKPTRDSVTTQKSEG